MKRIYITLLLLIFCGVICICEYSFVSKSCDSFVYKIDRLETAYKENHSDEALKLSAEINEDWEKQVKKIDMLLYHDYVDAISGDIAKLSIYITEESSSDFYSTCKGIKESLTSLKNSEIPNLQNII